MTIWSARFPASKSFDARSARRFRNFTCARCGCGSCRRGDDFSDTGGRRRDAAHQSGLSIVEWKPVTGVLPPLCEQRLAGRIREIPGHPAIPRTQPRHEPRRVQDDLLVGMDAPAAGALDRRGVPAAVSVFSCARLGSAAACARGCGRFSAAARCSARSAGGWCRRACRARASACRNTGWRFI